MTPNNPYNKYNESKIFNASPEELTLMLFDGALKFCNQSLDAVVANDIQKAHDSIMRVEDIIQEFQITLDMKYPVAEDFARIFDYMLNRLVLANARKDKFILEEVRNMLRGLRDTWKEAMIQAKRSHA